MHRGFEKLPGEVTSRGALTGEGGKAGDEGAHQCPKQRGAAEKALSRKLSRAMDEWRETGPQGAGRGAGYIPSAVKSPWSRGQGVTGWTVCLGGVQESQRRSRDWL